MADNEYVGPTPLKVTLIAGTGDGGVPHDMHDQTVVTPGSATPNLVVQVVPVAVALAVRFGNAYVTCLVGIITAMLTPYGQNLIPASDFGDLLVKAALLSISGPVVDLLKNLITIFGKLEGKFPLMTGNV